MTRVMVIEDESMVRQGIIQTIDWTSMGCIVIGEASNGQQGIDLIRELKPDLIITDVRMPRLDGVSMIKRLRSEGCISKFILLTAHCDFSYVQEAVRAGASDYLLKPLKDGELEATVTRIFPTKAVYLEEEATSESTPFPLQFHPNEKISNKYVIQAIQSIKAHCSEDITINTIADYLEISEGYLSRVFKKETGYTFTNYLSFYRIQLACTLLKNCRMKVYEVANKVGYTDTTYFSTIFKKLMGISPSDYQNQIISKH